MTDNEVSQLIGIIDNRIRKIVGEDKYVYQYSGIVMGATVGNKTPIRIAGYDTVFMLPNATGQKLQENDCVYIQCMGKDLNSGIVSYKFTSNNEPLFPSATVTNVQLEDGWVIRLWSNGFKEAWKKVSVDTVLSNSVGIPGTASKIEVYSDDIAITIPSLLSTETCVIQSTITKCTYQENYYDAFATIKQQSGTEIITVIHSTGEGLEDCAVDCDVDFYITNTAINVQ